MTMPWKWITVALNAFLAISFYAFWHITQQIGTFLVWVPENLSRVTGGDKDFLGNAFQEVIGQPAYQTVWNTTVASSQEWFLYIALFWIISTIVSFVMAFKK